MYNKLIISILGLGVFLRIWEYLGNRSMRLEEASIALNLVNKSFLELAGPLDPAQFAPLGFLWLERLAVILFGGSEYSLRLFPLLVSIISILLFYKVSSYFLDKTSTLLALFIFSISNVLIYYSSEAKQYSFDVFTTVWLYYLVLKFYQNRTIKNFAILILAGGISIWFAYTSVFVLASVGLVLLIKFFDKKVFLGLSFWAASCLLAYAINLHLAAESQPLSNFWKFAFAPNPLRSLSHSRWYLDTYLNISYDTLNMAYLFLPVIILIVAIFYLIKKSKTLTLLLISPILFAIIASMSQRYPLIDRFILFFLPNFLIVLAFGLAQFGKTIQRFIHIPSLISQILLIALIFYPSLILDIQFLSEPRVIEDIKPVLEFYSKRSQIGDKLYLYYAAEPAFLYYAKRFGLNDIKYTLGRESRKQPAKYREDLNQLKGQKRVWIIFSHVVKTKLGLLNEEEFFLNYLDSIGKRLDQLSAQGAAVYLYDLSF